MGILGYFRQKGGSHPIHRDFIKKKLRIFRNFSPKGGGSRQFRNFLIRKNWGFWIAERRGGGLRISEFFWKKNSFFLCLPLSDKKEHCCWHLNAPEGEKSCKTGLVSHADCHRWIEYFNVMKLFQKHAYDDTIRSHVMKRLQDLYLKLPTNFAYE